MQSKNLNPEVVQKLNPAFASILSRFDHMSGQLEPQGAIETQFPLWQQQGALPYAAYAGISFYESNKESYFASTQRSVAAIFVHTLAKEFGADIDSQDLRDGLKANIHTPDIFNDYQQKHLGKAANILAKNDASFALDLAGIYAANVDERDYLDLAADLVQKNPSVASKLYSDITTAQGPDAEKTLSNKSFSSFVILASAADQEQAAQAAIAEAMTIFDDPDPRKTYPKMITMRNLGEIVTTHPHLLSDSQMNKMVQVTENTIKNAADYNPTDSNQLLADGIGFWQSAIKTKPEYAGQAFDIAKNAFLISSAEVEKNQDSANWLLTMRPARALMDTTAALTGRETLLKTQQENKIDTLASLSEQIMRSTLLFKPRP